MYLCGSYLFLTFTLFGKMFTKFRGADFQINLGIPAILEYKIATASIQKLGFGMGLDCLARFFKEHHLNYESPLHE